MSKGERVGGGGDELCLARPEFLNVITQTLFAGLMTEELRAAQFSLLE